MQDVIAGHVKIMFSSLVQTTPFIKSGQLIALGTGGAKRSPVLPDVPTIAEAGVPGYVADNSVGPRCTRRPAGAGLGKTVHGDPGGIESARTAGAVRARGRRDRRDDLGRVRRLHQNRNHKMGSRRQRGQHSRAVNENKFFACTGLWPRDELASPPALPLPPCKLLRWTTLNAILKARFALYEIPATDVAQARADFVKLSVATARRMLQFWLVRGMAKADT